jgi:hypothetical protein
MTNQGCTGQHLCPTCNELKPCAFGRCAVFNELKCDSCLYVEEYGPKTVDIIEKAIAVAAMLDDATTSVGGDARIVAAIRR